jgi:hypothetical protein
VRFIRIPGASFLQAPPGPGAPELTFKELDLACRTYFVKHIGYVDYDEAKREPQPAGVDI